MTPASQVGVAAVPQEMQRRHRAAVWLWCTLSMIIALWLTASTARGQYETYELPENFTTPKIERDVEQAFRSLVMTRDLSSLSDQQRRMAAFYLNRFLPWKLTQRENLPEVSATLEDLLSTLNRSQNMGSPGSPAFLNYFFQGLRVMAEGNYMPSVRIAATLALGRLQAKPFNPSTSSLPVPFPQSLPVLMELYANEGGDNPDGVVAAALHGIEHFVRYGFATLPNDRRQQIVTQMNQLLDSPAPEGRSVKAHAYLQRTAVDILEALSAKDDPNLGTQLVSVSTSEDRPDMIALYSAARLGKFRAGVQGAVEDPEPVLKGWSKRAYQAVEAELDRLAALTRPTPASPQPAEPDTFLGRKEEATQQQSGASSYEQQMSGSMMSMDESMMSSDYSSDMMMSGMGMMGMMGMREPAAKPQPPEVALSRRQLNHVLQQLLRGATGSSNGTISEQPLGLSAAVAEAQRASIGSWVDAVRPIVDALNDETLDDRKKWVAELENQRVALARLAGVEVKARAPQPEAAEQFDALPTMFNAQPEPDEVTDEETDEETAEPPAEPAIGLPGF